MVIFIDDFIQLSQLTFGTVFTSKTIVKFKI